jgi:hypothetical protein
LGISFLVSDFPASQVFPHKTKDALDFPMPNVRKLRVSNPHRRKRTKNSRRRARRSNPAEVLIMANPHKRRRRSNKSRGRARHHRNPASTRIRRYRHSRRGRNPNVAGFNTTELVKLAGGAAIGVVGGKYLAQLVLGGSNSGPMGAAAQGIATLALAWGATKLGLGKDVATGIAAGGLGVTVWSLIQQYTGTGGNMSGLGDPEMARFLGDFQSGKSIAVPSMWTAPVVAAPSQATGRRRG